MATHRVEWIEPNILLCIPPDAPGEAPLRAYYGEIRRALERDVGPFVNVTDTSQLTRVPTATERRVHTEMSDQVAIVGAGRCVGSFIVVQSSLFRAALTALMWLQGHGTTSESVATREEAMARARANLGR